MVEFALVVPILCVVLFGILQFGALYNDYVTLTDATRVGARKAATSPARGESRLPRQRPRRNAAKGLDAGEARRHRDRHRVGARGDRHGQGHVSLQRSTCSGSSWRPGTSSPRQRSVWNEPSSQRNRPGRRPQRHLHGRPARRDRDGARRRLVVPRAARDPVGRRRSRARRRAGAPREHRHLDALAAQYLGKNGGGAGRVQFSSKNMRQRHRSSSRSTRDAPTASSPRSSGSTRSTCTRRRARAPAIRTTRATPHRSRSTRTHPLLNCHPLPCFNQATTLDLQKTGPGAFRLLNLDPRTEAPAARSITTGSCTATTATCRSTGTAPIPGAAFNDNKFKGAMNHAHRRRAALPRLRRGRRATAPTSSTTSSAGSASSSPASTAQGTRQPCDGSFRSGHLGGNPRVRQSGRRGLRRSRSRARRITTKKEKKRDAHDVQG